MNIYHKGVEGAQREEKQEIIIIAAMAENRVIGKDNAMPWSIKGNLSRFKETTMGWPCIMGRKTWESLPKKPLPGRLNIIVSKTINKDTLNFTQNHEGHQEQEKKTNSTSLSSVPPCSPCLRVRIFGSIQEAIEFCADYEKMFICGGESIYTQAMPIANKIELTLIPGDYDGDTFFPEIDDSIWVEISTEKYDNFKIITYQKRML